MVGKFNKPAATGARPAAKKKSRYAGAQASRPRDPMPYEGVYVFRIVSNEEGYNQGSGTDSHKKTLQIVELDEAAAKYHAIGDSVLVVDLVSGKAGPSGIGRVKAYMMAAAGFDDEAEYNDFDPDGEFIDSASSAGGPIEGRFVACKVTRGNLVFSRVENEDGSISKIPVIDPRTGEQDYYRQCLWSTVDEASQDVERPTAAE